MADNPESTVDRPKSLCNQFKALGDQFQSCMTVCTPVTILPNILLTRLQDIIAHNDSLKRKLAEAQSELMDKKDVIRTLRLDLHKSRHERSEIAKRASDSDQVR
jgi:hypothetical protein